MVSPGIDSRWFVAAGPMVLSSAGEIQLTLKALLMQILLFCELAHLVVLWHTPLSMWYYGSRWPPNGRDELVPSGNAG